MSKVAAGKKLYGTMGGTVWWQVMLECGHEKKVWIRNGSLPNQAICPVCAPGTPRTPERDAEMALMRDAGETYQAIGDRFNLSRERARQVVYRQNERRRRTEDATEAE